MASLNRVMLIGNLGGDPEVKFTPSGSAVANVSLAVNESYKDKEGQKHERTEWVRLVVWGKQAEVLGEHAKKGHSLYVEGRLQTREWENKEGKKQFTTEVHVSDFKFLTSKPKDERGGQRSERNTKPADDDIPF